MLAEAVKHLPDTTSLERIYLVLFDSSLAVFEQTSKSMKEKGILAA